MRNGRGSSETAWAWWRRRRGAARRTDRAADRAGAAADPGDPRLPRAARRCGSLNELIIGQCRTVLEEIGVAFVDNPAALARWKEAGADVTGERVRIPRGLAPQLCATAPAAFTQIARNPSANSVEIGGRDPWCWRRSTARPSCATLEGGRRYATMADFRNARETRLHVEMAAPFGRHGVRADRCAGEQAPSRHAAGAYDAVGQAVHGLGHRTLARRRQRSRWRRSCSAPISSTATR
jgi:trimethylamine:corrinoid methyltransferase-like protein